LYIVNQYFDFNNIEEPVQYFIDSSVHPVFSYKQISKVLKARKTEYTLNDALLYGNPTKVGHFFTIHEFMNIETENLNDPHILVMDIWHDQRIEIIERTLRNSVDVFGDIGGIFEIVNIILVIPITFISSKLLQKDVCNEILLYDQMHSQKLNKSKSNSKNEISGENQNHLDRNVLNERIQNYGCSIIHRRRKFEDQSELKSKAIQSSSFIQNRYTYSDLIYNMI
jgi:hypothetical protein